MLEKRENWVPQLINGKYVIIDKETKEVINDFQGYGSKSEQKCWNWIHNQQQQVGIYVEVPPSLSNALF